MHSAAQWDFYKLNRLKLGNDFNQIILLLVEENCERDLPKVTFLQGDQAILGRGIISSWTTSGRKMETGQVISG